MTPHSHEKPPARRRLRRLAACASCGVFLGLLALGVFIDHYGQQEQAQPAQAIVILGAGFVSGRPGDSQRSRTLHAAALYRRGLAPAIICTGGQGRDEPITEAQSSAELAAANGVPRQALYLETRSTSTRENAEYAAVICRRQGWTRVIVVSDPYHLWRAHRDFTQVGLIAYPSPALDCRRNREIGLRMVWVARETLLTVRDLLLHP